MHADERHNLEIDLVIDGDYAAIDVAGELDTTSSPRLINTVRDVTVMPVRSIDLNCGRVWFLDSAGVRALIVARNEATRLGVDLALADVSEAVTRVLDMTGLTGTLTRSSAN